MVHRPRVFHAVSCYAGIEAARRMAQSALPESEGAPIMSNRRKGYVAYLLRLWQAEEGENAPWRASLESPQTGERQGFANLVDLFTFLEEQVCQVAQGQPVPDTGEKGGDGDT
jgi:hypothetical protein